MALKRLSRPNLAVPQWTLGSLSTVWTVLALLAGGAAGASAQDHDHAGAVPERLGRAHFQTSCSPDAQREFDRALAMLHSFFFPETVKTFTNVATLDPGCAIAWWGVAFAQRPNPLVGPFDDGVLQRGLDAVDKGLALNATFSAQSNTITITETSLVSFTLASNYGTLAPTSPLLVTNVTPLGGHTASINGSVTGSGTATDGNNYTVAMAALLSEIKVDWHPTSGVPTLTTAFTSAPMLASGSVNFIDWYGNSATSAQAAALSIPEPATWAWSLGAISPGIYLLWRKQRQKPPSPQRASLT